MRKNIEEILSCIWLLMMFSPILAYLIGWLDYPPDTIIKMTFTTVIGLGFLGGVINSLYEITKDAIKESERKEF